MSNDATREQLDQRKNELEKKELPPLLVELRKETMERAFQAAMPKGLEAVQLVRDMETMARRQDKLYKCQPREVLGAAMTFAQLGLRVGTPLGHGWVLPFKNHSNGTYYAQTIIGYKGYVDLSYRSKAVANIRARAVHEADEFDFEEGTGGFIHHKRNPRLGEADRGDVYGYYVIVTLNTGGEPGWHYMPKVDVEAHRDKYAMAKKRNWDSGELEIVGPWKTDFGQMALKTTYLRLSNWLPRGTDVAYAHAADGRIRTDLDLGGLGSGDLPTVGAEFGVPEQDQVDGEIMASPEQIGKIANMLQAKCGVQTAGEGMAIVNALAGTDVANLPDLNEQQAAYVLRTILGCVESGDARAALDQAVLDARVDAERAAEEAKAEAAIRAQAGHEATGGGAAAAPAEPVEQPPADGAR